MAISAASSARQTKAASRRRRGLSARALVCDAREFKAMIAEAGGAAVWSIEPADVDVRLPASLRDLLGVRSTRLGLEPFCIAMTADAAAAQALHSDIRALQEGRVRSACVDHRPASDARSAVRLRTALKASSRGRGRFAVLGLSRQVTDLLAIAGPSQQRAELTSETVRRSPGCAALYDRDGCLVSASQNWEHAVGLTGRDYVGRTLQEMIPDLSAEVLDYHRRVQLGEHLLNESEAFVDSDGRRRWFHCEYRPYIDAAGVLEMYSANAVEVTALFEARSAAQANARRLELALDAARVGAMEIDLIHRTIWTSPEVEEILGQTPDLGGPNARPWPMCHPDDRERLDHHIDNQRPPKFDPVEFRIVRPTGESRWVEVHYNVEQGEDGTPTKVLALLIDNEARKQQELALVEAKQASQAAAEAKSQFLANMSHELRTPMNGVLGVLHLLANEPLTDEGRHLLGEAEGCGRMLAQLLNDVVDFSRVEAGRLELSPEPMNAAEVLESVVRMLHPQADAKGVELRTRVEGEDATILADSVRLQQVLFNLIGNAVKFTTEGHVEARIAIRDDPEGDKRLRIEVEDTGIGVPEAALASLFQRFEQGDSSTARRFGGSGLGLAITRALAELMGGEVDCRSVEGEGSTFWFDVPVKTAAARLRKVEAVDLSMEGLRILVVEDNPTNQLVISKMLAALGAVVETADDGIEGLEAVQTNAFDLILMDVQMPRMDGVEATRRIRALGSPAASTPIIGLTANVLGHQRQAYLAAGMNGVAAKPISPAALIAEMGRVCQPASESDAA